METFIVCLQETSNHMRQRQTLLNLVATTQDVFHCCWGHLIKISVGTPMPADDEEQTSKGDSRKLPEKNTKMLRWGFQKARFKIP
jgi:hypothetical protein